MVVLATNVRFAAPMSNRRPISWKYCPFWACHHALPLPLSCVCRLGTTFGCLLKRPCKIGLQNMPVLLQVHRRVYRWWWQPTWLMTSWCPCNLHEWCSKTASWRLGRPPFYHNKSLDVCPNLYVTIEIVWTRWKTTNNILFGSRAQIWSFNDALTTQVKIKDNNIEQKRQQY